MYVSRIVLKNRAGEIMDVKEPSEALVCFRADQDGQPGFMCCAKGTVPDVIAMMDALVIFALSVGADAETIAIAMVLTLNRGVPDSVKEW